MDDRRELGIHQTIEAALRREQRANVPISGYWRLAANTADDLADRMQQALDEGDDLIEIELRTLHGFAIPELRAIAQRWRAKVGN